MSPERKPNKSRYISEARVSFIGKALLSKGNPEWRRLAACRNIDPDKFYPRSDKDSDEALAICETCHVWVDCLKYAIEYGENEGIWGGCTSNQRRDIVKRLNK